MNAGARRDMACYHCQQGAEKYLKGFLVSQEMDFLYVTILSTSHSNAWSGKWLSCRVYTSCTNSYEVWSRIRYPMDDFVAPDVEEAMNAIKLAENIATFVKSNL